ncbi:MAG: hypothetical protein NVSMB18_00530 [Acetobacteraceae bacterium]
MTPIGAFLVPPEHPSLEGHFPGNPIVPGVVLLDSALAAILGAYPGRRAAGLPSVKFLRPVRPGQEVGVACALPQGGRVAFACTVDGAEVVRGTVLLGEA